MKTLLAPVKVFRSAVWSVAGFGVALLTLPAARAFDEADVTVVSSRASEDYVRPEQSNGAMQTETYTFGEGGFTVGPGRDQSIDGLTFSNVVRTIARPLANQNYVPGTDPKQIKLLLMVYWGTTTGTGDPTGSGAYTALQAAQHMPPSGGKKQGPMSLALAGGVSLSPNLYGGNQLDDGSENLMSMVLLENRQRDRDLGHNANVLGYDEALAATEGEDISAMHTHRSDLLDELGENRYFVVLMAYDFQMLLTQKKPKLLWVTRFSVRQLGNDFDQRLGAMAQDASRYFGRDTHGLTRTPLMEGQVKMDDLKFLGTAPDK